MKKFETQIADLIQKNVQFKNKDLLRAKLMQQVAKSELDLKLETVFRKVKLSVNSRVLMKEKLFMLIEASRLNWFEKVFASVWFKKSFSLAVCLVFLFGLIVQPFSDIDRVRAYNPTRIGTFSGNVNVVRNGELLSVYNDFVLLDNDVVQTGPGGFAEVIFADDSIARLSRSTRIGVNSLDNKTVNSNVELNLLSGELWVNTLGVAGSTASFVVNAGEMSVVTKSESIFDLEVQDSFSRVVALESNLDLQLLNDGVYVPANLKKGQLVKVKKETPYATFLDQSSFEENLVEFNLDWIASNYKQDEFYQESLSETRILDLKKKAGITPDSYFYPVKEFQRAARLALTFNPVRSVELELMYANQKLYEAEVLFDEGKTETALIALDGYSKNLSKVVAKVSDLDSKVPEEKENVKKLKEDLVASVSVSKRDLSRVAPTGHKDEFKEVLKQAEVLVAETLIDKYKTRISQTSQTLNEVRLLVEEKKYELAVEKLNLYLSEIALLKAEIEALSEDDKLVLMPVLLEADAAGVKLLEEVKVNLNAVVEVVPEPVVEEVQVVVPVAPTVPVVTEEGVVQVEGGVGVQSSVENSVVAPVSTANQVPQSSTVTVSTEVKLLDSLNTKITEVQTLSQESLSSGLQEASKIKSPILIETVNRINSSISVDELSKSTTVLVQEVVLPKK